VRVSQNGPEVAGSETTAAIDAALAEYRDTREALETAILPLATSVDGRRFSFQASLHGLELEVGGYVAIEAEGARRLGQILSLGFSEREGHVPGSGTGVYIRAAAGEGVLLTPDAEPFHDGLVAPATPDEVRAWLDEHRPRRAQLDVAELALVPGVPFGLDAGGFGRHTFVCGQSGSGKTYSLGVLLERLLIETSLRIVVLDPNSDYVRLGEPSTEDERYREAAASVAVRGGDGDGRIKVRLRDLSPARQGAMLRLDPLSDREEYAELLELLEDESVRDLGDIAPGRADSLLLRARNLGLGGFSIWPRYDEGRLLLDELVSPEGPRCLVVDLGSLGRREEQILTAGAVLEGLWAERERREPVAIVIDEAHNVCPAEPGDALSALATDDAIRIAGEGRKFGLYLIVVTQRPQKVHPNVLSQCDNLVLMRVNSVADLAHVGEVFSFVPAGLIERAPTFGLGEALVAGKIAPHPALVRFGSRLSYEGGGDVPSAWAGSG
jgi:Helicase HerA, central domain